MSAGELLNSELLNPAPLRGRFYIGTAGWHLPAQAREPTRSYLEQYSTILNCTEINSSFYRHHMPKTYSRWRASVPGQFRFAVKAPRQITHERGGRLTGLSPFLREVSMLELQLGPILFQFPPGLAFDPKFAGALLSKLRSEFTGAIVFEPRHPSWAGVAARNLLRSFSASLVAADPQPLPGGPSLQDLQDSWYLRLHGNPRMYYSDYSDSVLDELSSRVSNRFGSGDIWCIFDNTAVGAAFYDAFTLHRMLQKRGPAGAAHQKWPLPVE